MEDKDIREAMEAVLDGNLSEKAAANLKAWLGERMREQWEEIGRRAIKQTRRLRLEFAQNAVLTVCSVAVAMMGVVFAQTAPWWGTAILVGFPAGMGAVFVMLMADVFSELRSIAETRRAVILHLRGECECMRAFDV